MSSDGPVARVDFAGIQALSSRSAGYAVAEKCLQVQADAEALDPSLKTAKRVILHEDAKSWYIGALGEMEVGRLLQALGPEWFVRHAVPIGAGTKDVDHLVVGPGGIFAINTKHHAGASVWVGDLVLRVNNSNTRHLRQGQADADDVARRLTAKLGSRVEVRSVIAVLNARSITDSRSPVMKVVSVIDASTLVRWLLARPRRLSDTELALIGIAAEEPETWHIDPRAADTLRVMQRFERLVKAVGTPTPPRAAATRPRTARSRRSAEATPKARQAARPGSAKPAQRGRPTVGALFTIWLKAWLALGAIVVVSVVTHLSAVNACTTPIGCALPAFYFGIEPFLYLGVAALFMAGFVRTVLWAVRRFSRPDPQ